MAAMKKALITLFGGRGQIPQDPSELEGVAHSLFAVVRDMCDDGVGSSEVTKNDLFHYLVTNSESGISKKTVDALFAKVDVDGSGAINEEEFVQVIQRCYKLLKEQLLWDDPSTRTIPDVYVVPGSSAHNAKSGTQAFRVAVVRRKSMRRLWQVYQELDSDNDGYVSLPEFKKYIKKKQAHVAHMSASIFSSLDRNRDGIITFRELLQNLFPAASKNDIRLLLRMAKPQDFEPSQKVDSELMSDVRNIFQIFDDDHSGSLDQDEFTHALQLLGFDEEEAAQVFKEIDSDGSGEVSIAEFEAWYDSGQSAYLRKMEAAERDSDADEP